MFQTLNDSAVSEWLNSLLWGFPAVEIFHIVMTGGFFGGILMLDLRLLGFGRNVQVSQLLKHMIPKLWLLFVGVLVSGGLLFMFMPLEYSGNGPFLLKLLLIPLGGLNALIMHLFLMRRQYLWDVHAHVPGAVKFSALISILIWIAVLACGRLIAYFYGF